MNVPTSLPSASLCFFLPLFPLRSYSIYYSRSPPTAAYVPTPFQNLPLGTPELECVIIYLAPLLLHLYLIDSFSRSPVMGRKGGRKRQEEDERRCTPLCDLGTRRWNTRRVFCQPSIIESWAQAITLQGACWQAHLQAEGHRSCLLP